RRPSSGWPTPPSPTPRLGFPPMSNGRPPQTSYQPSPPKSALRPGDRVAHASFGEGIVVSVVTRDDDQEVTVAFPNQAPKRLLASYAKLRVIT
ncbi:MAG TPA: hypothetical protein VFZ25_20845, partial [Chloroflexota bacterium]|nr:hypothetical protein [Chloroflexota bacterium]